MSDVDVMKGIAPADEHNRPLIDKGGALHLLSKRGDATAVKWLLEHGADPNALWSHWDADVTPLHLAAAQGHLP